ncbi:MAG: SDR family oxidoreductase [Dehalococcoidia bacterium]
MRGLRDRVGLITGAGRGIGKAAAIRLAEEGVRLVLNDLDEAPLAEVVQEVKELGGDVLGVAGSAADQATVEAMMKAAVDNFGDLHILVTCAGFTWDGVLHRMTDEQWQTILDVHLTGTFKAIRAGIAFMRERARQEQQQGGSAIARKIVTISSLSGYGNFGQANYAAAKSGIVGLTKTAAIEGAMFNILANAIAFGIIDTRLTRDKEEGEIFMGQVALGIPHDQREQILQLQPLRRAGTVEEAAGAIAFLASDDANYISGQVIDVNGGSRH